VALDLETAINDPGCLLCIEWPEKLQRLYHWDATTLVFRHTKTGRRVTWTTIS
jgi:tRNA A37 threonylcarbamoyladenosine biosynthesis protein TsaE